MRPSCLRDTDASRNSGWLVQRWRVRQGWSSARTSCDISPEGESFTMPVACVACRTFGSVLSSQRGAEGTVNTRCGPSSRGVRRLPGHHPGDAGDGGFLPIIQARAEARCPGASAQPPRPAAAVVHDCAGRRRAGQSVCRTPDPLKTEAGGASAERAWGGWCAVDRLHAFAQEEALPGLPEAVVAGREGGRLHPCLLGPERPADRCRTPAGRLRSPLPGTGLGCHRGVLRQRRLRLRTEATSGLRANVGCRRSGSIDAIVTASSPGTTTACTAHPRSSRPSSISSSALEST